MLERINIEPPKVGSVEEFQGQEKMAIIVSVVRSSPDLISYDMQRALGFVANARRLNVALSRARAILIILGMYVDDVFIIQNIIKLFLFCLTKHFLKQPA